MLHELQPVDFKRVLPILDGGLPGYFPIVLRAIIEGNTPGRLWVDDPSEPQTLLMWDHGSSLGLAGRADGTTQDALTALIAREIAPVLVAKSGGWFKLYFTDEWGDRVDLVLKGVAPQRLSRVITTLGEPFLPNWKGNIPAGCEVRPIDQQLLASGGLANVDRVKEEIACCWTSLERFLDRGFGFCVVTEGTIASWCTAEYASGNDRGIGIETVEEYQRRGFATLTASAFVEHCLANGITPYWDAWKNNLASIALARKVGFREPEEYSVFLGRFAAD